MRRFDLEAFVAEVRRARDETDSQAACAAVLARALSVPGQVRDALGEAQVGPQPIYSAPDLTIVNLVWSPLMVLQPHDHRMWATVGVYTGREDNILWDRRGAGLAPVRAVTLGEGELLSLPADAIHSVVNPLRRLTGAIHIYGGDFYAADRSEWDPDTLTERPMDFEAAKAQFREADARFRASDA